MGYRSLREQVRTEIIEIQKRNPRFKPGLAIIQVGDRPDSTTYVRMKGKAAQEVPLFLVLGSIADRALSGQYPIHTQDIPRDSLATRGMLLSQNRVDGYSCLQQSKA
jgi:hypothetical protein